VLLVARGQEVTTGLLERLRNFPADVANRQVVPMISQKAPAHRYRQAPCAERSNLEPIPPLG
jgi:hypothetical protein